MDYIVSLIEEFSPVILASLWRVLLALIIFFVGRYVIDRFLNRAALLDQNSNVDIGLRKFVRSLLRIALWALLIYFIAHFLGIPTASFIAVLGTIGATIGLALQGSLSNFASGLLLLFTHPFKVGDYIEVESTNAVQGTVEEIGLFFTTLKTADNKHITVPNGTMAGGNIINYSACTTRRIDTVVGIAYDADVDLAIRLLTEMLRSRDKVIDKENAVVYVKTLGPSSVDLGLRCWTATEDYWEELWAIHRRTKEVLDAAGISIPFNQLDVHLVQKNN